MNSAKVLVVEDDQFIRDLYVETLRDEGYAIDSAINGTEGLKKILESKYDLVLLDIIMPDMDGLTVAQQVRANPIGAVNAKTIVFLTNLDKDEEIQRALKLGDGYIIKSKITPGDLLEEVKKYLVKKVSSPASA